VSGVQITFDLSELGQINSCGYQRAKSTAQQEYPYDKPEIHGLSALQRYEQPDIAAPSSPTFSGDSNPSGDGS
jgi:hypothetical protein